MAAALGTGRSGRGHHGTFAVIELSLNKQSPSELVEGLYYVRPTM